MSRPLMPWSPRTPLAPGTPTSSTSQRCQPSGLKDRPADLLPPLHRRHLLEDRMMPDKEELPRALPDAQPTAQPKAVPLFPTLRLVLPRVPLPSTTTRPRPTGYPATHRLTTKREQDLQRTPNEFTSPEAFAHNEKKLEGSAMGEVIYRTSPRTLSSQRD